MNKTRFTELLTKRDCGDITLLEQKELTDLMRQNEKLAHMAAVFDAFNEKGFEFKSIDHANVEHRWADIEKQLEPDVLDFRHHKKPLFHITKAMVAASVLAVILISAVLFFNRKERTIADNEKNIVVTKRGSKSYLRLPDGTQVWLNDATKISYDKSFGERTREVLLSGEAYFDVAKNPSKPFIVHTTLMDVTALGTSFNVNAYENSENIEATLIEGSVQVTLKKDPNKKILLKPFEKISVQNNTASENGINESSGKEAPSEIFTLSKIKKKKGGFDSEEAQWVKNKLVFANSTLEEIAQRLSRWYDVEIRITEDFLKSQTYSAEFDNLTLEEVMQSLKLTGNFHYSINNKTIVIAP